MSEGMGSRKVQTTAQGGQSGSNETILAHQSGEKVGRIDRSAVRTSAVQCGREPPADIDVNASRLIRLIIALV